MIKNIIFDLGNVLVQFNSNDLISHFFDSCRSEVKSFYFDSLWNQYDQGLYTVDDMIQMGVQRFPELHSKIVDFMQHWTQFVIPIPENVALIQELKKLGYRIFILSNIPEDDTNYLREKGIFTDVDGGVYSYQEKRIKPDPEIFKILLKKYNLNANECLFLDDRYENIESANQLGFVTIKVEDSKKVVQLVKEKLHEV